MRRATRPRALTQARASDSVRGDAEASMRAQLAAATREHDMRVAMLTKQFEAQLAAAEKAASSAHRQYEGSMHSGEKLIEVRRTGGRATLLTQVQSPLC